MDKSWVSVFIALVFQTLHSCSGNPDLICSRGPITALVGDDVILPCRLEPSIRADSITVVWTKPGLEPKYVHYHEDGRLVYQSQHQSYQFRTRLFDELKNGNVSMKIMKVKVSDGGEYECFIPSIEKEASIQLIVGSVSSPVVTIINSTSAGGGVVLQCESRGWYPEPEVLWLDAEGNLLCAGTPETVRGPDDLYTVSSRVTVDKRHNNSFTCRVQQNNTHQTREAHIHVPDEFFKTPSRSSPSTPVIIGIVIGIMFLIVLGVSLKWRKKQKKRRKQGSVKNNQSNSTNHDVLPLTDRRQRNMDTRGKKKKINASC